ECYLRVFTHYGNLPKAAYQEITRLNQGIAGYVAATGQPLLIKDISQSQFYKVARYLEDANKSLMSAPIMLGKQVMGVINVSSSIDKSSFDEQNLELLQLLALFIGKSIQIVQLQSISRSKFVEMAVACELGERYTEEPITATTLPNPNRLAKIVAKAFFQELTKAGFGPSQIIEIANEVLNLLQKNIDKYRKRLFRDDGD
ncbi:MAG: GAF domain-containing protein, partial [Microcystaceae cyanobacterium]